MLGISNFFTFSSCLQLFIDFFFCSKFSYMFLWVLSSSNHNPYYKLTFKIQGFHIMFFILSFQVSNSSFESSFTLHPKILILSSKFKTKKRWAIILLFRLIFFHKNDKSFFMQEPLSSLKSIPTMNFYGHSHV